MGPRSASVPSAPRLPLHTETSIRFPSWGGKEVGWKTIDEGRQWTGTAVWPEPLSMHYMEDRAYGAGRFHFSPVLDLLMEDAS